LLFKKKYFSLFSPKGFPADSPRFNHTNSSASSTATSNSRITSYYTSLHSSRKSNDTNTLYASSRQSDSLYNQPMKIQSPKIITTSFNKSRTDSPKLQSYRDLSTPPTNQRGKRQHLLPVGGGIVGKLTSSNTSLSHRKITE
jgi:hypothetical protein